MNLLFLTLIASCLTEPMVPLYSHSLRAPYLEDQLNNRWWNFGGDAIMEVNRRIRLTSDVPSQDGWIWSKFPLSALSWIVEFEFKVMHAGVLSGDGFAFWYTKEKEQDGPVFGSKDLFTGFGLFFDTYANSRTRHAFPLIMGMIGDGKTKYDHEFDGKSVEAGSCVSEFRNKEFSSKARITYIQKKYLKVEINIAGTDGWTLCFQLDNIELPQDGYLGFSALTGDISSSHDIISIDTWKIMETTQDQSSIPAPTTPSNPAYSKPLNANPNAFQKSNSGWSAFSYILLLIFVIVVGYIGWVVYQTSKSTSYKRF